MTTPKADLSTLQFSHSLVGKEKSVAKDSGKLLERPVTLHPCSHQIESREIQALFEKF
ncbi:MAG: hypothetical protein H0W88_01490 [Parachlamydiaceae bacterium]|nr:hypothetical protein [Parachlamydiaceae bacterium]